MKKLRRIVFFAGVVIVVVAVVVAASGPVLSWFRGPTPSGNPTEPPSGPGWINLLDDEHAPYWENVTDQTDIFDISDEILHIYGRSIHPLRYVAYIGRTFGDFDLHLEFKTGRWANSGLFLRSDPGDPVYRGFEIQILDDHGKPAHRHGTGAVYDVVTPMFNVTMPRGEWNSFDVSLRGRKLQVFVNGWKVIDTDFGYLKEPVGKFDVPYAELPLEGHIMLQDHGGKVWFRNILIREAD